VSAASDAHAIVLAGDRVEFEPRLTRLPQGCRMEDNANAFIGGFRLWEDARP